MKISANTLKSILFYLPDFYTFPYNTYSVEVLTGYPIKPIKSILIPEPDNKVVFYKNHETQTWDIYLKQI